jgi:PAS domain S-box-containing protein
MTPSSAPVPTLPQGIDDHVFRTLFAAYPDGLVVVDADGRIVLANPAATTLLGYASGELVGLPVEVLVPEAIRPRHAAYRGAYAQQPVPRPMGTQMDLVAKRRDGSEVMVEIALSPLQEHGLPLVVAAIRGIGGYPRVQQVLQRARRNEHLAQLGRAAVDARDIQQLLQQVPATAAEALQVDAAILHLLDAEGDALRVAGGVGLPPGHGTGTRVPNRPDTPDGHVVARSAPVRVEDYAQERRFVVPDAWVAARYASGLTVPLSDRGRVIGTLGVHACSPRRFDDDEQRFLESLANLLASGLQRAASEEALQHAQRLESVGQLTGGIAHDFNNLLTVLQGNLQILADRPGVAADGQAPELLAAALRAARRGAELTGKLLAFSRRQVLQPTAVDLVTLLTSLADMLGRTLDQRIRIGVRIAADCPAVRADPGQLEAALLNIAINARDAMPDGGRLAFDAARCDDLPAHVRETLDEPERAGPDRYVAISISDTGTGMSEAVKERAFEPFFTTKEAGRGTGLGLSTVYGFVKQSRGAVAIESRPGAGTTLTLYIPQARGAATVAAASGDDAVFPAGLKVLLVEDDAEVRTVVEQFLHALGARVTSTSSAEQALPLLGAQPPHDLLLSDIALGAGQRGTELAALARERLPGIAVLLMSGYSEDLLAADRDAPPDWELLQKPFGRDELAAAIVRLVDGAR